MPRASKETVSRVAYYAPPGHIPAITNLIAMQAG